MIDVIADMKKSQWISCGYILCLTLSLAFLLLDSFEAGHPNPAEEMFREKLSGVGLSKAPGPASHVPLGNIPTMFRMFKFGLMVEAPDFPIAEMEKTSAWAELQKKVTAYDEELERMRNEVSKARRRMSDLLMASYTHSATHSIRMKRLALLFTLGAIVFMLLDIPNMRRSFAAVRAAKATQKDVTAKDP